MTREEAIYCMKSYLPDDSYKYCIFNCKYYKEDSCSCESSKAHAMAIKALEIIGDLEKALPKICTTQFEAYVYHKVLELEETDDDK